MKFNGEKLLYLEDDLVLAKVTKNALLKRGLDVCHFETIAAVKASQELQYFDFAILDLKLEDGNSLELIEQLKRVNHEINILVLTGYASISTAVKAVKLGATNYLAKPATVSQILASLIDDTSSETSEFVDAGSYSVKRLEWEHIQRVLDENNGNISAAARQLKMHRRTLQRKLKKKPVAE